MAFQLEGKEMCCERYIPSLFSQKCCWSFHPKLVRIGKHTHSQQKKSLAHKLCSFTSSLCACAASSASIECIFQRMIYCSMV